MSRTVPLLEIKEGGPHGRTTVSGSVAWDLVIAATQRASGDRPPAAHFIEKMLYTSQSTKPSWKFSVCLGGEGIYITDKTGLGCFTSVYPSDRLSFDRIYMKKD